MSQLLSEERLRFRAHKLLAEGKSVQLVAHNLKKDAKWVKRNEKRFEELGTFKDRPRTGQPKKMTEGDRKRLVKRVKGKERKSTRKVSKAFKTKGRKNVGRETIRVVLKKSGLFPHKKRKTPFLTDEQKKKRVSFARKYRRHD